MAETNKRAIICDLDGTLSLFDRATKNPYNRDFENDTCSEPVKLILELYSAKFPDARVLFLSGRNYKFSEQTIQFLNRHVGHINYELIMRTAEDTTSDILVKHTMYEKNVKDKYKIDFVIDDRLQVCRLWHSLGLFVFNVNQGLLDF